MSDCKSSSSGVRRRSRKVSPAMVNSGGPPHGREGEASNGRASPIGEGSVVDLSQLVVGIDAEIRVLICRQWDDTYVHGKYIGAGFTVSDSKGNSMLCTARSGIAQRFVSHLLPGNIYSLEHFFVTLNKDMFRVRNSDSHIITLEGNTVVKSVECPSDGFVRHPFQLVEFEDVVCNGSKFLIDVIGSLSSTTNPRVTPSGTQFMDCHIMNHRCVTLRITLWGQLCSDLLQLQGRVGRTNTIIFPSMNVREYRGEAYLSSTSGTQLFTEVAIPQIKQFKAAMMNMSVGADSTIPGSSVTRRASLQELLEMGRQHKARGSKGSQVVNCHVRLCSIRTKNGWYYDSCSNGKCKEGITKTGGNFRCDGCKKPCEFPQARFRLEVDVADSTATAVVTLFDDIAEKIFKHQDDEEELILPRALLKMMGTEHTLELRAQSYYDHVSYESFTCSNIVEPAAMPSFKTGSSDDDDAMGDQYSKEDVASGGNEEGEAHSPHDVSLLPLKRKLDEVADMSMSGKTSSVGRTTGDNDNIDDESSCDKEHEIGSFDEADGE